MTAHRGSRGRPKRRADWVPFIDGLARFVPNESREPDPNAVSRTQAVKVECACGWKGRMSDLAAGRCPAKTPQSSQTHPLRRTT